MEIEIRIGSRAYPQGSKRAFVRGGRAVLVESSKQLPEWRRTISEACTAQCGGKVFTGAVSVGVVFEFKRAKSSRRVMHTQRPDVDKLLRALLDGLTDGGIWKDDSQVVEVNARKVFAAEDSVMVTVSSLE